MSQPFDSTAWMCSLPNSGFGVVLVSASVVMVGFALVIALAAVIRCVFNPGSTRRAYLAAVLGSAVGFAFMSGGCVLYLSFSAWADVERFELDSAVFVGALVFASSAIALCKLRGALPLKTVARPGHGIVNLIAILLCGWLGYGFVTGQAQPSGLAALLATGALACAIGVHMMTSREYSGRCALATLSTGGRGVMPCIEWHGGETQAWVMREITPDSVRAAAYRRRRDWHNSDSRSSLCVRHRLTQFTTRHRL